MNTTTTPSHEATESYVRAKFAEFLHSTGHTGEVCFSDSWKPHSNGKHEYCFCTTSFGGDGRATGMIRTKDAISPSNYWAPTFADDEGNPDPSLLLPEWFTRLPIFHIPPTEAPILIGPDLRQTDGPGIAVATVTARPTRLSSPFKGPYYESGIPLEYGLLIELRSKRYTVTIGASKSSPIHIPPCGIWAPGRCLLHLEPVHVLETDKPAFRLLAIEDGAHVAEELRG